MKRTGYLLVLFVWLVLLAASCKSMDLIVSKSNAPDDSNSTESTGQAELPSTSAAHKFRVGISLQDESPFVMRVSYELQRIIKDKAPDVELVIYNGETNPLMQTAHVESFISAGFDLILLDPISYEECKPAVMIANEANIPIITFITLVSNQADCLSFVGSSHLESGIIEAEMVAQSLNGKGQIVILEGVMGISAQKERFDGYNNVFDKYPGITVVAIQTAAWQRSEAEAIVENWIDSGKKFDVVVSENDNMAMGAVAAIEKAGLTGEISVFGIDGDPDALQAVKDGRLAGTVYQDAVKQAQTLFECIQKLKLSEKIESSYLIPFESVTPGNVDDFLSRYN
ncbi:MAG: substrate-binding domain-containing protein [Eubacteriales bacterium]